MRRETKRRESANFIMPDATRDFLSPDSMRWWSFSARSGTASRTDGRSSSMSSATVRRLRTKEVVAPIRIGIRKFPMKENAWKSGSTFRKLSDASNGTRATVCSVFATKLPCVSIAPLGRPVVPLV